VTAAAGRRHLEPGSTQQCTVTFHLSRDWADWILFITQVVTLIVTVTAVVLAAPAQRRSALPHNTLRG
jgi:hypothetical protein